MVTLQSLLNSLLDALLGLLAEVLLIDEVGLTRLHVVENLGAVTLPHLDLAPCGGGLHLNETFGGTAGLLLHDAFLGLRHWRGITLSSSPGRSRLLAERRLGRHLLLLFLLGSWRSELISDSSGGSVDLLSGAGLGDGRAVDGWRGEGDRVD